MRIVFLGSGAFGLPTLERVRREHDLLLAVSQPDRPAGRRRALTPTPIAAFARDRGLELITPANPNDDAIIERIRSLKPDALVVIAYGHKLDLAMLEHQFAINLHASLLPKYRGAAPINWAMINDERETGVSVITLAQRMDAGDILAQRRIAIDPYETAGELHDRLAMLGPEAIIEVLKAHEKHALNPLPQDESLATLAPKLSKRDGTVRFNQPARLVRARVHGLTPWPGCTVSLNGLLVKLLRVDASDEAVDESAGTLLPGGRIACQPGSIRVLAIQPPGGRSMSFEAYSRGHALPSRTRCQPV